MAIKKIEDDYFLLNRETCTFHSFNRTGTFLWELVTEGYSYKTMVQKLIQQFDVTQQQAEEDAYSFLMDLQDNGIITICGSLGMEDSIR